MGRVVDTGIWIHAERVGLDLKRLFEEDQGQHFVSVITASELLHGVARAIHETRRELRSKYVEEVLARFEILLIDLKTARTHASIQANLQSRGVTLGAHDLWIAATCLAYDHSIVTLNVSAFRRVPGLTVEPWSA